MKFVVLLQSLGRDGRSGDSKLKYYQTTSR